MRTLRRHKLLAFAVVFVAIQVAIAVGATWISPYDPTAQSVARRLRSPSALHWLGTDQLGRDVLARILYGYRTSLVACVRGGRHRAASPAARSASWPPITAAGSTASSCAAWTCSSPSR